MLFSSLTCLAHRACVVKQVVIILFLDDENKIAQNARPDASEDSNTEKKANHSHGYFSMARTFLFV